MNFCTQTQKLHKHSQCGDNEMSFHRHPYGPLCIVAALLFWLIFDIRIFSAKVVFICKIECIFLIDVDFR